MGGKNNRAKALQRPRNVYRLPGQVVLATPVTIVAAAGTSTNFLASLYSYLCLAASWFFAFSAPIVRDVCRLIFCVMRPISTPICFCLVLGIAVAGLLDLTRVIIDWLARQPAHLFNYLTGALSDPELNGAARGATCISTFACFAFAHFCSKSAFAYQETLLNVTIPARPMWELLLGTRSEIELGKQFTDSASTVTTVLEDLALMCHSDHLGDVAAMRSFALNAKIGSDSVEQGDVRDGLFAASRYGSDMLSGVEAVAQLSTTVLSSVRSDVKKLIRKVAAEGPSRSFYYTVRAVLTTERVQISRLIKEVERVERIAIKATQHYDRFQPLLSEVYKKYDEAYSAAPPWSIALDYAVSTLGHIFVGKAPSDLGYVRANLSRSHDAMEKLDKIMVWLSQYKDALSHYNNNLEDMMDRLPGYAQHIWNSKTADEAWPHLAELAVELDAAVTKTLRIRNSNPGLVRTILRDTFGKR